MDLCAALSAVLFVSFYSYNIFTVSSDALLVSMTSYTKLARFMSEKHRPILRTYQHLAVRNLLYLQAEICHLESKYETIAKEDSLQDDERKIYSRDWMYLESSHARGFGGVQWTLALEIRLKLREYHDALLQYSKIASLRQPKIQECEVLQEWMKTQAKENRGGFLGLDLLGTEQEPSLYDSAYRQDMAILSDSHGEDDLFTKFITGPLLRAFHFFRHYAIRILPVDAEKQPVDNTMPGMHQYNDEHVGAVTHLLGTVLSSLAPLTSIIALSFVTSDKARLGLICAFTLFFSLCLAVATKARRVEIFAATAAFASVQVVFVGSSGTSAGS